MIDEIFGFSGVANAVGGIYIFIGITGTLCNMVTLLMITCYRMYRLSAYTIMANLALADAIMLIIAGLVCGLNIIQVPYHNYDSAANNSVELLNSRKSILSPKFIKIYDLNHTNSMVDFATLKMNKVHSQSYNVNKNQIDTLLDDLHFSLFLLSFLEIAAWTAGIISYALLGINRCVAICFYRTRAKTINRVSFALIGSTITWLVGIITAYFGTMPVPLMGMRTDMWTVSFLNTAGRRPVREGHRVLIAGKKCYDRIYLPARLTFQFFYPSLICTISSIIFFAKPFMTDILTSWQYIFLHLVWLCNHMCNPFIYAYFNERMRLTYGQWLTCAPLRKCVRKLEKQYSRKHGEPLRVSKRLNASAPMARNSYWSNRSNLSENFVRSSLQMQSRDFEQFCEVMMSVNTANESSEGWTESSSDTEAEPINTTIDAAQRTSLRRNNTHAGKGMELHSLVFDLGRQTVEHWAKFAKKASL
ncbi:putative G-protein coupled receptor K01A12.3 [Dirofilaria immitis]|nr:putative G-protein coupled receptor K01A12.3 [Dirofilaria immitis]